MIRRIDFTEDVIAELEHESQHHSRAMVRRRMQALLLKSRGLRHKEIAAAVGISATTLRKYLDLFMKAGIDGLREIHPRGRPNRLLERRDEISAYLDEHLPRDLRDAQAKILSVTGLKRSLTQVRAFLITIGIEIRR